MSTAEKWFGIKTNNDWKQLCKDSLKKLHIFNILDL